MPDERKRVLNLGAGTQSSVLAVMADRGDIEPVEVAIFADTQAEPLEVYEHLDWLEKQLKRTPVGVRAKECPPLAGSGARRRRGRREMTLDSAEIRRLLDWLDGTLGKMKEEVDRFRKEHAIFSDPEPRQEPLIHARRGREDRMTECGLYTNGPYTNDETRVTCPECRKLLPRPQPVVHRRSVDPCSTLCNSTEGATTRLDAEVTCPECLKLLPPIPAAGGERTRGQEIAEKMVRHIGAGAICITKHDDDDVGFQLWAEERHTAEENEEEGKAAMRVVRTVIAAAIDAAITAAVEARDEAWKLWIQRQFPGLTPKMADEVVAGIRAADEDVTK